MKNYTDLKDHLQLITPGTSLVDPKNLGRVSGIVRGFSSLKPKDLSKKDGISENVYDLIQASDLAFELMGKEVAEKWMSSPQDVTMGHIPGDLCLAGLGCHIIDWLSERLGRPIRKTNKNGK